MTHGEPSTGFNEDGATHLREIVERNAEVANSLRATALSRARQGRADSAMAWVRAYAAFSTVNPTGWLRDLQIEDVLDRVAHQELEPMPRARTPNGGPRVVLHVLSEAHLMGGHINLVRRWTELDTASESVFVLTRPEGQHQRLRDIAGDSSLTVLFDRSLVERSRTLRTLTSVADLVIAHTHPDDPVPGVAFGDGYRGPPVIFVNHADHVFGLGCGRVSVVANLRRPGAEVGQRLRGHAPELSFLLPTPIDAPPEPVRSAADRSALGIPPGAVVALTMARDVKYPATLVHPGFAEVLDPVLTTNPELVLVAAGPAPEHGDWPWLASRHPGRVLVLGMVRDTGAALRCADIYLDSFPFASITSLLEAAAWGLPVLASGMYTGTDRLLGSHGVLEGAIIRGKDVDDYRGALGRLVSDPSARQQWGALALDRLRNLHTPNRWPDHLEELYLQGLQGTVPDSHPPEQDLRYADVLVSLESRTQLLWTLNTTSSAMDRADRARLRVAGLAVRAGQLATRTGTTAKGGAGSRLLVPRGPRS